MTMSYTFRVSNRRRKLYLVLPALVLFFYSVAQNSIVAENQLPGNPKSEWDISGAGSSNLQGFATDISVNKGQRISFKIRASSNFTYNIKIYRLGYYQGNGARLINNLGNFTGVTQPNPVTNRQTGLVDCGNWSVSAFWDVPSSAVSGIYIAKLTRNNNTSVTSHIVFIVRDDASTSDLYFQTSDATWQAYNNYGGYSLYVGSTSYPRGHAVKVSYNRPFLTRSGGGGGGAFEDWLFNAEYPMIRFLERNGYDVSYTTNVDVARRGQLILNHKVLLSVGHDEYWSAEQRANVEAARSAGVHLAFFSGNEVYWKTRWENSVDGANTAYRTLVCYKEGTVGENVCSGKCDPTAAWTGLWREGCAYPSGGGCLPENALTGQISWADNQSSIKVPAAYRNLRFWRNTSVASLANGQVATLTDGTLGYEWNPEQTQYAATYPAGRIKLSETILDGQTHHLSLYRHSSGALVFGAGTVQWSWGLDNVHDRGNAAPSAVMQQATVNLFADMGVQPATLQAGLVKASASTDVTTPQTTINTPVNGSNIAVGTNVTISGVSSDVGGVVAGVEISLDGGTTWQQATGTANWTYSWLTTNTGAVTIKVRGFDDSGNMEVPGNSGSSNSITVSIGGSSQQPAYTIFQPSNTPAIPRANDGNRAIEVGVKFRSAQNGYITGIRYYKGANTTGTHKGHLWSSTGSLLAEAVFSNESASGWQQALFASPVAITAGLTYVASYHSASGDYAFTNPFFTQAVVNGPLRALASGEDGPNGVYRYTTTPAFPNSNYQTSNYWVDVVFTSNAGPDVTAPVVSVVAPANGATGVAVGAAVSAVFNEDIDASSVGSATFELRDASNQLVPAAVAYNASGRTAVLTPSAALVKETTYRATLKGGTSGIRDLAGNALAANYSWTFTTLANTTTPPLPTEGPGGPVLVVSTSSNPFSRYAVEILRAEGLNHFAASDISQITAAELDKYDVVVLGEVPLTTTHTNMLANWVNAGGTLIAFRPSTQLSGLLGITKVSGSLSDKYLLVHTTSGPGVGIVNQTIQFHGVADLYTLNGATVLATLYENATTATIYPAVTSMNVGTNGGKAIAFTYDLAKSIIYTRQGNPAWAGQKRTATSGPIRAVDMFFGISPEPHWVDLNKVAIPQADEQQRLLTNIIIQGNMHRKPLPRFWFLPRGLKAAIVMTGDDHRTNGTTGRFNQYLTLGPNTAQDVADWKAVRGTSYIYNNTPISNEQAAAFEAQGFEIALHVNTNCSNFTAATLQNTVTTQLSQLAAQLPGISAPVTTRNHCVAWSDWASAAKVYAQKGIRLDANYYYWPQSWMQNRPGMFTGSGMPMRFADLDGSIIDCYQVTTQMTDETNMNYSSFCNQLLDKAIGPDGYYGVFCANMHTDANPHPGSDQIIASALARQIPVISAKQMLTWLDGRNGSFFGPMVWSNNQLSFSITALSGAHNLKAMLPLHSDNGVALTSITRDGQSIAFTTERIKGMQYAFFDVPVGTGNYVANYNQLVQAPIQQEGGEFSEQPLEAKLDVTLQPNPSSNYFDLHIKSDNDSPVTVRILNMLGQVLQRHENIVPNTNLQLGHNLPAGAYLFEVMQRDKRKTVKGFKL